MIDLKTLEELRTKEEVLNFFKQLGKNITEEEIYVLKQSYNQAQKNNEALTIQQLDDVAGGQIKGLVWLGANDTRSENWDFNIDKITLGFTTQGKFNCYTFHDRSSVAIGARNVFFLTYKSENTGELTPLSEHNPLDNIEVNCEAGTRVQELINNEQKCIAVKVENAIYFYEKEAFSGIDRNELESFLRNHATSKQQSHESYRKEKIWV